MSADPFYNRKPVPDELIDGVGFTGLTNSQEAQNRERKFSVNGVDVRKFDNKSTGGWKPQSDPYYGRKPVPDSMIHGVGDTGMTKEEEYMSRERKYSVTGVDVRKFDMGKNGWEPVNDPYYHRKSVDKSKLDGVGETYMPPVELYAQRANKEAAVNFSTDPFMLLKGSGNAEGIDGQIAPDASAQVRRRSSAIAPDAAIAAARHHAAQEQGNRHLETVPDAITPSTTRDAPGALNSNPSATNGHGLYHDQVTV